MSNIIETAIRSAVAKGVHTVANVNRSRARGGDTPHPYLTGIHEPMTAELTLENLAVTGEIPAALDGRYLRIGPNPAAKPNPARYHWFAGDGMVHGIRIAGGKALWYRNRWVRSARVSATLGETPIPGPRLFDGTVNTNVIGQGGRFFALVEAGATPVELSEDLTSRAHNPFDGTLRGAFSAHPHRDPETGELHAICYHATDPNHVYHVMVGTDGRVRRETPVAVEHGPSIHDCAITERFVLVFDLPVTFSMPAMLAGYEFPYRWNTAHKARVGLLPRGGSGDEVIWCEVDPCYVYHPSNAYDLADGRVVVDVAVHDRNGHRDYRGPDAERIAFERWTIDPLAQTVAREVLDDTAQEFPRIDERRTGKPYRYAYSLCVPAGTEAANMIDGTAILKHDLHTRSREIHDFGANRHPGEFVFIPRSAEAAEDDGWLMGLVIDVAVQTTDLVILHAANFTAPPVAAVHLPHRVPPGFHGNWVAAK
ncbi:MAG: carotenoid oxygenase [Acidocella sp. 20-63-7]|nr:MAG: carotenoid oxygenase [Acidocella sp. 20-63-7]